MGELLMGIDIGTSSSKGVLVTPEGEIVATASRPHDLLLPRPGWAEHDPENSWWGEFVSICRELIASTRDGDSVAAVCASGIGPCLLPTDEYGNPLRPAILYGIDTRATAEIEELTGRYGADTIMGRGGSLLSSQAVGPKLLWLRRQEPEVWRRTRRIFMANSFIVCRLTGEYTLDHHSASQCDPLYDIHKNSWIAEWAEDIAPGLPLPRLVWPGEIAGRVTHAAAEITGLREGTPVAAGTVDAWAEALSVGVQQPGDVMLMYGTTMFIVQVVPALRPNAAMWGTAGIFPGTYTLAAGMATSGALTSWFKGIAGDPPFEILLDEAASVPPGSDGLVVLPYFAGERTPIFDPDARGMITGLTLRHRRGHLYRALLEGTAYGVRHILDTLAESDRPGGTGARNDAIARLVAVGGGTKGGLWTQIVTDVTGREQQIPQKTIGASYGDAMLAGLACGLVEREAAWNPLAVTLKPNEKASRIYAETYSVYRSLYPSTREEMHRLAHLQKGGDYPAT